MGDGAIRIEQISGREAFEEFARLPFKVYADREAWWPPDIHSEIALLSGQSPLSAHLELAPFSAFHDGHLVARVSAVVNHRYIQHWGEQLGQLVHFEAMPGEDEAVVAMLNCAVRWLRERGMKAARSGFVAFLDYPYAIDNYGALPSFLLRGNPDYYHCYFKNAGFQTEKGQVDYTTALTSGIVERYPRMIESAAIRDVIIQSWREYGFVAAIDHWTDITNASFVRHWGWNPISRAEARLMMASLWDTPAADLSMMAVKGGKAVGTVFSMPDLSFLLAQTRKGATIGAQRGGGRRGVLVNIGVLEEARGCGIALAMGARSFMTMAQQGMRYAGYTLVHDDNWASRRTAESLGGRVTGNFVTYRRDFQ